jgi:hypothetical protein
MPKCYMGTDGYYEIFNQTSIIHQKNNDGKSAKFKIYNNIKNIPSSQDRWRIEQIIQGKVDEIKNGEKIN